jgi:hypothetical protein
VQCVVARVRAWNSPHPSLDQADTRPILHAKYDHMYPLYQLYPLFPPGPGGPTDFSYLNPFGGNWVAEEKSWDCPTAAISEHRASLFGSCGGFS